MRNVTKRPFEYFVTALVALTVALTLTACSKSNSTTTQRPANVIAAASQAKAPPTPQEWKSALMGSYNESQVKDKGDGVTTFMAMFKLPQKDVVGLAFGERDAFRKLRFYKMGMPMQIATGVKAYISLKDNGKPVLFLQPYYWGDSWLFMDKVAVLVDGELVMEHTCPKPDRDTEGVGVKEQCDFILSDEEIAGLRKITNTSKVAVRLTGTKGYTNVDSKGYNPLKYFVADIQSGIAIYDAINKALEGHIPPQPTT
jgi:hypothetical protein